MFSYHKLNLDINLFDELSKLQQFEIITTGRMGTNIIQPILSDSKLNIPIVRTTSIYQQPASLFTSTHHMIIDKIKGINNNVIFNNALVEIYNDKYRSMGFHSDQSLDLHDKSFICIFSCYNTQIMNPSRKLIIKSKITNEINEFILEHNSIVLFSNEINKNFLHKIIYIDGRPNNWLGITFRYSKTYIHFMNDLPYFSSNNNQLLLANEEQQKIFYKYRSQENKEINFSYPNIDFTISPSDLMLPFS